MEKLAPSSSARLSSLDAPRSITANVLCDHPKLDLLVKHLVDVMDQSSGKLHPRKKQKLEHTLFDSDAETASDASTASTESEHGNSTSAEHDALNMARRPITPPLVTRAKEEVVSTTASGAVQGAVGYVPSPVRLTRIRDLPDAANVDTISLREILQDPLIKEQWQFNYLLDIDFIM